MSSNWFDIDIDGLQEKLAKTVNEASKLDNLYDENQEKKEKMKLISKEDVVPNPNLNANIPVTTASVSSNHSEVIHHYSNNETDKNNVTPMTNTNAATHVALPVKPKPKPKPNVSVGLFADDYYAPEPEVEEVVEVEVGVGDKNCSDSIGQIDRHGHAESETETGTDMVHTNSTLHDGSSANTSSGNSSGSSMKPSTGGLGDIIISGASVLPSRSITSNSTSGNSTTADLETGLEEVDDVEGELDPILLLIQRNKERLMSNLQYGINSAYHTPTKTANSNSTDIDDVLGGSIADTFKKNPVLPTTVPPPNPTPTPVPLSTNATKSSVTICTLVGSLIKGIYYLIYNILLWVFNNIRGFPPNDSTSASNGIAIEYGTLSSILSGFFSLVSQMVTLLYTILASLRYCINGNGDANVTLLNKLADPNIISK